MTHTDLKSKINALAVARAASLFRVAEDTLPAAGCGAFADPADTSGTASLAAILRAPMLGKELNEGRLIEIAVALALETPGTSVMRNVRVPVTDSDMNLVTENTFSRLAGIKPPAPGRYLGTWEIDVVRHNSDTGLLQCLDLKRTALDDTTEQVQRTKVEATSIAAWRFFRKLRINETQVVTLRWNATDQATSGDVFSGETIDKHLRAPVRETVEAALVAFRNEFDRRFDLLVRRAMARPLAETPRPQKVESPHSMVEPQTEPLTLKEAWRLAMRARRLS